MTATPTAEPPAMTVPAIGNIVLFTRETRLGCELMVGEYLGTSPTGRARFRLVDRRLRDPEFTRVDPKRVKAVVAKDLTEWVRSCATTSLQTGASA